MKKTSSYLQFKVLLFIAVLYITIDFASNIVIYKIVDFGPAILPAGIVIYPLLFLMGDVIAELFGYKVAKLIVIYDLVFNLIFAAILFLLIKLPSPPYWALSKDYNTVLGSLLRVNSIVVVSVLIGSMINIYFVTRWKTLTKGRFFWLRSIGSSAIGEAIALVLAVFLLYSGKLSLSQMFNLMKYDYLFRISYAIIGSVPATLIVNYFKNKGLHSIFEKQINFNPFLDHTEKPSKQ